MFLGLGIQRLKKGSLLTVTTGNLPPDCASKAGSAGIFCQDFRSKLSPPGAHLAHQQLHVVPGVFLGRRVPQQIGGVVSANHLDALVIVHLAPKFADRVRWFARDSARPRPPGSK